jgi:CBS domain-containing protein
VKTSIERGCATRGPFSACTCSVSTCGSRRPLGIITDRDVLTHACGDIDDLRSIPLGSVMVPCTDPLREVDTVGSALRTMCARRQWHLPIVCSRGLFLGALDIADISLWLRDRLTMISVDAAFAGVDASG